MHIKASLVPSNAFHLSVNYVSIVSGFFRRPGTVCTQTELNDTPTEDVIGICGFGFKCVIAMCFVRFAVSWGFVVLLNLISADWIKGYHIIYSLYMYLETIIYVPWNYNIYIYTKLLLHYFVNFTSQRVKWVLRWLEFSPQQHRIITELVWFLHQKKRYRSLKIKGCQFGSFIATGRTVSFNDNLQYFRWGKSYQIDDILFSVDGIVMKMEMIASNKYTWKLYL